MAGTETKRIIELTEASTVQNGDFIAVDSSARGTKKVSTDALATSAALTAETNARTGADEQMSERMDGIEEQTALIQNPTKTLSGALCSFTDGADMPMVACTAEIVPKQSGSGTPSPSNVRPISGWESVSVDVSGVNIWNEEWEYRSGAIRNVTPIPLKPNTTYFLKAPTGTSWANVYCLDANGNDVKVANANATFTTTADTVSGRLVTGGAYGTTYNHDISINYPSTEHDYHAYTGTTTTVNLGRTVYGGTLDVVSGVLTVNRAMVDLGTLTWTAYGATSSYDRYITSGIDSTAKEGTVGICSHFQGSRAYSAGNIVIGSGSSKLSVFTEKGQYASASAFKTAMNGATYVYELATPQTYTLTGQEISTLLGNNNVWADSGDVEITYRRDISIVLENLENALSGSNSLNSMMMSAPTETTSEEPTEDEAEDDMR